MRENLEVDDAEVVPDTIHWARRGESVLPLRPLDEDARGQVNQPLRSEATEHLSHLLHALLERHLLHLHRVQEDVPEHL